MCYKISESLKNWKHSIFWWMWYEVKDCLKAFSNSLTILFPFLTQGKHQQSPFTSWHNAYDWLLWKLAQGTSGNLYWNRIRWKSTLWRTKTESHVCTLQQEMRILENSLAQNKTSRVTNTLKSLPNHPEVTPTAPQILHWQTRRKRWFSFLSA